jgi:hypothetical protein
MLEKRLPGNRIRTSPISEMLKAGYQQSAIQRVSASLEALLPATWELGARSYSK